jgi:hypothetical protein
MTQRRSNRIHDLTHSEEIILIEQTFVVGLQRKSTSLPDAANLDLTTTTRMQRVPTGCSRVRSLNEFCSTSRGTWGVTKSVSLHEEWNLSVRVRVGGAQKQYFLRRARRTFGQANSQRFCDAKIEGFWAGRVFEQA